MKTSCLRKLASRHARGGFTLVELLLVVAIIAVLSTLGISVIASSQNDARVAATRSRMEVIEELLATEIEDFEVRRSPLPFDVLSVITRLVVQKPTPKWSTDIRIHARNLKRMLTVDLMRSEFPDLSSFPDGGPVVLGQFPSPQIQNYFQNELQLTADEVSSIVNTARQHTTANVSRWSGWGGGTVRNAANSAEILYEILSDLDTGGSTGLDSIGGSQATGDTDNDGFPEVIDAWGDPIAFQFHQTLVILAEQEGPPANNAPTLLPPTSTESGVWKDWEGPERFTNFADILDTVDPVPLAVRAFVALPVLPSEVRFFLSSEKILEIEGQPTDFITARDFAEMYTGP